MRSTWILVAHLLFSFHQIFVHAAKGSPIIIGTFNIQNLSPKKISKPLVANTLTKIIQRYDVILIQEIQDKSGKVAKTLSKLLKNKYGYVLSPPTGRKPGEIEQYATFYWKNKVKVVKSELYPDPKNIFSRNPHLVQITLKNKGMYPIMLVNLHAKPDASKSRQTVKEINGLTEVYDYIVKKKKVKNVLMMGDMNAGGSYVRKKEWKSMTIRQDPKYVWLIGDGEDTTVGKSHVAYDRIIAVGTKRFLQRIQKKSARVNRFDKKPKGCCVMMQAQALKVSDHYPVEITIS